MKIPLESETILKEILDTVALLDNIIFWDCKTIANKRLAYNTFGHTWRQNEANRMDIITLTIRFAANEIGPIGIFDKETERTGAKIGYTCTNTSSRESLISARNFDVLDIFSSLICLEDCTHDIVRIPMDHFV